MPMDVYPVNAVPLASNRASGASTAVRKYASLKNKKVWLKLSCGLEVTGSCSIANCPGWI